MRKKKKRKALDELHEQHPNRTMIIDDVPLEGLRTMCDTADKLNMISIEDMYNRAMAIKKCSVIYYDDLMNDKECAVWHTLSKTQKV